MAFRLKLVPDETHFNFFRWQWLTFGISAAAMVLSVVAVLVMGLNFGIDFKGGTTIRTESTTNFDVGDYRQALEELKLGDVSITEVFDPSFGTEKHVAMIRIGTQDTTGSVTPDELNRIEGALKKADPNVAFTAVESVGPKVSGELIMTAVYAVGAATIAIMFYIWLRFEWQFALGAVVSIAHDVLLTIGIFAILQLKFDLSTIAALLTTLGYSVNDTVVVFDRLRENLIKCKTEPLIDVMNRTVNETLSRTVITGLTAVLALGGLAIFGGPALFAFSIIMIFGIVIGTYSSIYVAAPVILLWGVKRGDEPAEPLKPAAAR